MSLIHFKKCPDYIPRFDEMLGSQGLPRFGQKLEGTQIWAKVERYADLVQPSLHSPLSSNSNNF